MTAATAQAAHSPMLGGVGPIARENLASRVYAELRTALMEGAFWPGHRFKIRELAAGLNVSETPVREALMQLVRERGLDMHAGRSITVAQLSLAQYLELRTIRLQLEGLAAEQAATRISKTSIADIEAVHRRLVMAEEADEWRDAVRANWLFHYRLYKAAAMPELLSMIEGIWLRNGPMLNFLYPHARPTYRGRHQHLNVLDALRERSPAGVREAIQADMIEGGALLVKLLEAIELGEPAPTAKADSAGQR